MTEYYIQGMRKMTTKKSRCTSYYTITKIFALLVLVLTSGLVLFPLFFSDSPSFMSGNSFFVDSLRSSTVDNSSSEVKTEDNFSNSFVSKNVSQAISQGWQLSHSVKVDYVQRNNTVKESREDLVNYFGFECEFGGIDAPGDVATDFFYLYVADTGNHKILKFTKSGEFVLEWGSFGLGDGEFKNPSGIAVDNDYVYVADKTNDRIQKFNKFGTFIAKWGIGGVGDGEFDLPLSLTVDDEYVYVTDLSNNRVQKFTKDGAFVAKWGSLGSGDGEFNNPHGIAVDDNYVYVADMYNHRVQKFWKNSTFVDKWGSSGSGDGEFNNPDGIAVDNDYVYVVDKTNDRVQQFLKDGIFHSKWGSNGLGDGEFYTPSGITVDDDRVYVSDYYNDDVQSFITSSDQMDVSNLYDVFLDDSAYAKYEFSPVNNPMYSANTTLTYVMYDLAYPTKVGIKFKLDVIDDGNLENAITDTLLTNTFDSSATYGVGELILYVQVGFSVDDGYVVKIVFFDTGTGAIKVSTKQQGSVTRISKLMFYIDYIWVETISTTSNPRFEYYSTSTDSLLMKLYLEVYDYRIPIKIYTDYELASINPNAVTGRDSSDSFLWVNNTVPFTYLLLFEVVLPKQYLAISDTTSTYLSDIGFEGSWNNDWKHRTNYLIDDVALNSTIVAQGAFSLRLQENSGSGGGIFVGDLLPLKDHYYFSAWIYPDGQTGEKLGFYYDIGPSNTEIGYTIGTDIFNDRWNFISFYFTPRQKIQFSGMAEPSILYLDLSSVVAGTSNWFLDSPTFLEVNHVVKTSDWRKIKVSGQMISWDGYQNPAVSSETIQLELRDRTADSTIVSTSKTTDSNGDFEWEVDTSSYSALQDQREIEVRSYSVKNWFGSVWTWNEFRDLSNWAATVETSTDEYLQLEQSSGNPTFDTGTWDLTDCDYYYLEVYFNRTLDYYQYFYAPDGSNYFRYYLDDPSANTWYSLTVDIEGDSIDVGSPDKSNVEYFGLIWNDDPYLHRIKDFHCFIAQKSYFTPQYPYDWDYAMSQDSDDTYFNGEDGIDFSEETVDGCTNDGVDGSENGYLYCIPSAGDNYDFIFMDYELKGNTETYFTTISMRIMVNMSSEVIIYPKDESGGFFSPGTQAYTPTSTSWHIYEWDLSGNSDFYLDHTFLFDYRVDNASDVSPSGLGIFIDWIRLFHRDTPSLSVADSYAWCSSSNNSFQYRIEHNEFLLGYYQDLQTIIVRQDVGIHNLTAIPFNDLDRKLVFLPGSSIESIYEVKNLFIVYIESYTVSSSYVDLHITASRSGNYYIFENNSQVGSQTFLSTGTSIYHLKNTTAGILVNLAYKFTNNSDVCWFNTSYSNIEFVVQTSSFADSEEAWQLWIRPTYTCNYVIYENETNIGSGTVSNQGTTLSKLKATEPGFYWINISFTYQSETIWANNSYYVSSALAYPQIISTPGNQTIEWGSNYPLVWFLNKIYQWELYRNSSLVYSDQTSNPKYIIPSTLDIGVYNFTCLVENQYENQNSSTVFITIKDTIAPSYQVSNMNNSFFEDQESDSSVIFTVNENVSVSAYRNVSLVFSGYTTTNFTVSIGSLGTWNITIVLTDNHSNSLTNALFYTIRDLTKPVFYNYDDEKEITMGSTIALTTYVTELNPHKYKIMYGSLVVASGSYTNIISYSSQFQYRGTYHYLIYANDTSGNLNYLHITVTVTSAKDAGVEPIDTITIPEKPEKPTPGFEVIIILLGVIVVSQRRKKK